MNNKEKGKRRNPFLLMPSLFIHSVLWSPGQQGGKDCLFQWGELTAALWLCKTPTVFPSPFQHPSMCPRTEVGRTQICLFKFWLNPAFAPCWFLYLRMYLGRWDHGPALVSLRSWGPDWPCSKARGRRKTERMYCLWPELTSGTSVASRPWLYPALLCVFRDLWGFYRSQRSRLTSGSPRVWLCCCHGLF